MIVADVLRRRREELQSLVIDLTTELQAIADSTAESPDDEHDAEGSTVAYERARVGALLDATARALQEIEHAIARSVAGEYGICRQCGTAIATERLAALPTAELCIACASQ